MTDRRNDIVETWKRFATREAAFHYTMDQRRDDWLTFLAAVRAGTWKEIWTDCDGAYELGYGVNGCPYPSRLGDDHLGWTGSLLLAGRAIPQAQALPADGCVVGLYPGTHVVGLMEPGTANGGNPLVFSHGHEQGISPQIRPLNYDQRMPRTFLRFDTDDHKVIPLPPKPAPVKVAPAPKEAIAHARVEKMGQMTRAAAAIAIHAGVSYYVWRNGQMIGSRLRAIPVGVVIWGYNNKLDPLHIPHAGA